MLTVSRTLSDKSIAWGALVLEAEVTCPVMVAVDSAEVFKDAEAFSVTVPVVLPI